jgi:hypothetical protein
MAIPLQFDFVRRTIDTVLKSGSLEVDVLILNPAIDRFS